MHVMQHNVNKWAIYVRSVIRLDGCIACIIALNRNGELSWTTAEMRISYRSVLCISFLFLVCVAVYIAAVRCNQSVTAVGLRRCLETFTPGDGVRVGLLWFQVFSTILRRVAGGPPRLRQPVFMCQALLGSARRCSAHHHNRRRHSRRQT